MSTYRKKLIEVALPLTAINDESAKEKSVPRRGHPQTIHLWWARRPLAAARAVLFAQLVDDPSSWPEMFPSEEDQTQERGRLFALLGELAKWENSSNVEIVTAARLEIARSHARSRNTAASRKILHEDVQSADVDEYLLTNLPSFHDPFAGAGTIPLEAQRLGLRVSAADLNPVAIVIAKALLEVPAKFQTVKPFDSLMTAHKRDKLEVRPQALADAVHVYSAWIQNEARIRLGKYYPDAKISNGKETEQATTIAWIWARTVESPNPAFKGCHVPLVSNFWLSNKPGRETWLRPVTQGRAYEFEIVSGKPHNADLISQGTKLGRGANFRCILSSSPIEPDYIKREGVAGRLGARLMAVVTQGSKGRLYLPGRRNDEQVACSAAPEWFPEQELPKNPRWFSPPDYGMPRYGDLFTKRQLLAMVTFSDLVMEARERACRDAKSAGLVDDGIRLSDGGSGATAFADAVTLYLSLGLGRLADYNSSICTWNVVGGSVRSTFARQAIPMTWDFYETNPIANTTGSWSSCISWVEDALRAMVFMSDAKVLQQDAATEEAVPPDRSKIASSAGVVISTDPPYYDNIGYAELSDFFYVWLRRTLRTVFPSLFGTMTTPKDDELVASPYRFAGSKQRAKQFFEDKIHRAFDSIRERQCDEFPITIYYAFKQSEEETDAVSSTGWETMLEGLVHSGLMVDGTWPVRTERAARTVSLGTNALASSIVLVCRKRGPNAPVTTRGEFRRMLRRELPEALRKLQQGNIAPVDVAQAAIGPGMAVFSRHSQVLEADGSPMTVRSALQLINEVLDEYLASGEGDFDPDTRFAITWYEQHGWETGPFDDAEKLAKARNVSVSGVVEAGICKSAAGKVRILRRQEMRPLDYDPVTDERPTVWEFTQHLIRNLEEDGEEAAARLLKKLGTSADATRELAYRLYNTCERRKWAEDARSYNGLILAWPELEKLASKVGEGPPPAPSSKAPKKASAKPKAGKKGQQTLFGEDK